MSTRQLESLAEVWRINRIQKVLFFTYRFDFRWFVNFVLPKIRAASTAETEILVIASIDDSPNDDVSKWGEQYLIKNWFSWEKRFRVVYLPSKPIFHAKFIVIQNKDQFRFGLGSANLTTSGWERNFEIWDWSKEDQIKNAIEVLEVLSTDRLLEKSEVDDWITGLRGSGSKKTSQTQWLIKGNKINNFTNVMKRIKSKISNVKVVRIVSPYFDNNSEALFQKLLSALEIEIDKIELWIDSTGTHTNGNHLKNLLKICENMGIRKLYFPVLKGTHPHNIIDERPLHAKLIEVVSEDGEGMRVIGSANFTGAAWEGNNLESIAVEEFCKGRDFVSLLPDTFDKSNNFITVSDFKKKSLILEEDQNINIGAIEQKPFIYWAKFDEVEKKITVHYDEGETEYKNFALDASYNRLRDEHSNIEDIHKLNEIAHDFKLKSDWKIVSHQGNILTIQNQNLIFTPEWIRIELQFANGCSACAPIVPENPDFSRRDPNTGIPKELSSVVDLFGFGRPIVKPVGPTYIESDDDDDDEMDNPDEHQLSKIDLGSISESPEYNHLPESIKVVNRIKRTNMSVLNLEKFKKDLIYIAWKSKSSKQRILAKALLEVIDNEVKK